MVAWFAAGAWAGVDGDVARGWYLWQTGQDRAAAELAAAVAAEAPTDPAAIRLNVAMAVVAGEGAAIEASVREWWSTDPADPVRRVALAYVLAQRHVAKGGWCDEVAALVRPVTEGELRYHATLADRQRELRCAGTTDHADAELRRIAAEGGAGWEDGILAKVDAGYVKPEMPDELERLWTEHPYRIDRAGALWAEDVGGPGKAAAKRIASRFLDDAVESDDPVLVHKALLAWRSAGEDKKADEAAARLRELDPAADPALVRTLDAVSDPPEYAAIHQCVTGYDAGEALKCLDRVVVPASGALASTWHEQRRRVLDYTGKADEAYAEARAAWQADPDLRYAARLFAKQALARGADLDLASAASEAVLAGRIPAEGVAAVGPDLAPALANDLDLRAAILRKAGQGPLAVEIATLASTLAPTPARRVRFGMALAAAGRADEAVLPLAYGLASLVDDTALVTEGRDVLAPIAKAWGTTVGQMIDDASLTPGSKGAPSPLVGRPFADPTLLPEPADPKKPGVRVVALWAAWSPDVRPALDRLAGIAKHYAEKGVQVRAVSVDAAPLPADLALAGAPGGPAALKAAGTVALPTVVVVDAKGKVAAVLPAWDRRSLDLEKAVDALLPAP